MRGSACFFDFHFGRKDSIRPDSMIAEQSKLTMFADIGRVIRTLRFPSEPRGICLAADQESNPFKRLPGMMERALNRINCKKETRENMESPLA